MKLEDGLVYVAEAHHTDQSALAVSNRDTAETVTGHLGCGLLVVH